MTISVSAKAVAVAIGAAMALAAGDASAATFLLKDTGTGTTDVLNTTGELTGGNSAVLAGVAKLVKKQVVVGTPIAFTDVANFVVKPNELLTSYSITNLPTAKIGAITGGTAEIFKIVGMNHIAETASLISIDTSTGAAFTDFSDAFKLGPGNYQLVIKSAGQDFLTTQGKAKYSVELQGTAVPEPAVWGVMLMGFAGIGAAMRGKRRQRAFA